MFDVLPNWPSNKTKMLFVLHWEKGEAEGEDSVPQRGELVSRQHFRGTRLVLLSLLSCFQVA